ncbi:hypothetical protein BpHYR1_050323 [Brachionus plicatilis]|uniref:Uncharacterized protein n=1 Tax=Brachionus plicatilis TaxID=10195 RepID=A0A3M7SCZ0_BRAPC|nr:hypothetical protein BpHYR1_050323 [Brachionus plicatilis]
MDVILLKFIPRIKKKIKLKNNFVRKKNSMTWIFERAKHHPNLFDFNHFADLTDNFYPGKRQPD